MLKFIRRTDILKRELYVVECYEYKKDYDEYNITNAYGFTISDDEYRRYLNDRKMPLVGVYEAYVYLDEDGFYHNVNGSSFYTDEGLEEYYIHGMKMSKEEWERETRKKIVFSSDMIKTIKRILYIPEIYGNIYYECKGDFISLIRKI